MENRAAPDLETYAATGSFPPGEPEPARLPSVKASSFNEAERVGLRERNGSHIAFDLTVASMGPGVFSPENASKWNALTKQVCGKP